MQRLLNKTSLHFVLGFAVIVLAVLALTVVVTGYLGEGDIVVDEECLPGEVC